MHLCEQDFTIVDVDVKVRGSIVMNYMGQSKGVLFLLASDSVSVVYTGASGVRSGR